MRHVAPKTFPGTPLATAEHCQGYDPLWALNWNGDAVRFSTFPGTYALQMKPDTISSSGAASGFSAVNKEITIEVIFSGTACAPAPESGLIGTAGLVVVTAGSVRRILTGCCQPMDQAFSN